MRILHNIIIIIYDVVHSSLYILCVCVLHLFHAMDVLIIIIIIIWNISGRNFNDYYDMGDLNKMFMFVWAHAVSKYTHTTYYERMYIYKS